MVANSLSAICSSCLCASSGLPAPRFTAGTPSSENRATSVHPSFASGSRPVRSRTSFANDTAIGASMPGRADGDSSFISMPKPSNTPPVATCSPLPSSAPASAPIISAFACGSVLSGANR